MLNIPRKLTHCEHSEIKNTVLYSKSTVLSTKGWCGADCNPLAREDVLCCACIMPK